MSVVLPHPLGPSRPITCPRGMVSERPSSTSWLPRRTRSASMTTAASDEFIM
ncbi:hypothetical protein [Diaminobutyricibacter sp. McL0608]|uniref:hypothetical protein n=1 Tax=Leifsonia sp. McL0608 TaxID=3143537 RepID=UPI0031F2D76B